MVRKCTSINKIPWKGMCSTCAIIFRSIEILHHHFRNSHHQSLYFIHPHCIYILWSKIIFGLKFIFLYFRIWQCMNTLPLICMSLNKNSIYYVMLRSSKNADQRKQWWYRVAGYSAVTPKETLNQGLN